MLHEDHKDVLDLWANDNATVMMGAEWVTRDLVENPGRATACHNVANTLVDKAGTGPLTAGNSGPKLVTGNPNPADDDDMDPAVQNITNGGYIMEIKFHDDHSVVLISRIGDPNVEILEGWAGGGQGLGNNVTPYRFSKSVYEDHEQGRISKATAAAALDGACTTRVNLANNVGTLTRCVAGACGIGHNPFKVTVKMRANLRCVERHHSK